MQLQSTLHDPSQGIRVLYSRKICHFLKKTNKKACMYFLTTNAHLALARLPALRNQVAKVTRDVGGSSDPVLTKQTCKKSQTPFKKKKKKKTVIQWCQLILRLEEKITWIRNTQTKNYLRVTFPTGNAWSRGCACTKELVKYVHTVCVCVCVCVCEEFICKNR